MSYVAVRALQVVEVEAGYNPTNTEASMLHCLKINMESNDI